MRNRVLVVGVIFFLAVSLIPTYSTPGKDVLLLERRPTRTVRLGPLATARTVPVRTSVYLELAMSPDAKGDEVDPESVSIHLRPNGGEPVELLGPGQRFAEGASGWLRRSRTSRGRPRWPYTSSRAERSGPTHPTRSG